VREQITENPTLTTIIEPMLVALLTTREQLAVFDRLVRRRARTADDVRRLMTEPPPKGGCGLDLAMPTRPLASKRSTAKCADISAASHQVKNHLLYEQRLENAETSDPRIKCRVAPGDSCDRTHPKTPHRVRRQQYVATQKYTGA
jgi:hypothetical protein